nr:hypothetical protein [uncultured Lachnoclostridium sp.]
MKEEKNNHVQRNYKDTLFRMLFRDKNALLSLYNAISGEECDDVDALEIVTLENAIYMNLKNDLAFLIQSSLHLYEHQSTDSPNMALRNLFYISRELEKMVSRQSLYSSKQIMVPTPKFIVFYNGTDTSWERKVQKLSDAFGHKAEQPELELLVTMLNINLGKNSELLANCKPLLDYMQYVDKVRKYAEVMEISLAVEKAVDESIKEGILADFLLKNKAEAVQMSIFEFDEEKEMKLIRQDERDIGREEGKKEGKKEGLNEGIRCFILEFLEEKVPEERIVEKLRRRFGIIEEESRQLISLYSETIL